MSEQSSPWGSIDQIASKVLGCTRCVLAETRTNAVPGDGSPNAAVMFIGEGPGQNEDEQGLPFVGRAGKLLDTLLGEVPLRREDVFITNVVKCRPPGNRDPEPNEVSACLPYLEAQIELIDPRVIVTLGRHSMLRFYPQGKISNDHGRIINLGKRVLLPVYHPAAALRNPRLNETLREDMRRIPEAVRQSLLLRAAPRVGETSFAREVPDREDARNAGAKSAPDGNATAARALDRAVEVPGEDREQMTLF